MRQDVNMAYGVKIPKPHVPKPRVPKAKVPKLNKAYSLHKKFNF